MGRVERGPAIAARSWTSIATTSAILTSTALAAPPDFTDATAPSGLSYTQSPGLGLAFSPLNVRMMMGTGSAIDHDRDGDTDLFVLSGGTGPDRLFRNNGDGTFTDVAAGAGLTSTHYGIGSAVGDYDGDGWLDIFVTSFGPSAAFEPPVPGACKLYHNNGNGTFTDVAALAGVNHMGSTQPAGWGPAFGDYDIDGDLDLAVPSWTGGGTQLFRNEGNGTFTNVTLAAGVGDAAIQGFSARFVDMNDDRYPELLVACDFGDSRYFANNGDGTFTNMTVSSGTGLDGNGMGHAVGDLNEDGRLDWYVTSIFSPNSGQPTVPGTGNFLYQNQGDHHYISPNVGLTDGGWGWGTEFVDVDHDGHLDVLETNGWPIGNGFGLPEWLNEQSYLWRNNGDGTFTEMALLSGFVHLAHGRGLIRLDGDNDGDQDVLVLCYEGAIKYYRNDLEHGKDAHWLRLFFDTSARPTIAPDGIGTNVYVTAGGVTRRHVLTGGATFASTSELSIHIGLGTASVIEELEIHWADGAVTTLTNIAADQTLVIAAPQTGDVDGNGTVGFGDVVVILNAWGSSDSSADVNQDGTVGLQDLLIVLNNWT